MRRRLLQTGAIAALLALSSAELPAQELRQLPLLEGSIMRIDGTSNKSDWTVEVTDMEGTLWLEIVEDGFDPDSVVFVVKSMGLKSGKSSIMDRLMYGALKATEYPDIVYTLGSSGVGEVDEGDPKSWPTDGTLELAGVRDTLATSVTGLEVSPGRFVFTGSHKMSMREHEITPPTALFGALHTSEWVTVVFSLVFGDPEAE